ncbi:hypothetical protein [Qipengyuania marisflavi]|uniref:Uncharacterized protein n=1 Tax=Qipengyuania marisflavi TaxID=2486356 RepID=A0A5S3P5L8_9SPHN|nr:hypothetical protein [Qipengyuania marisflavi]TMM48317.1 hypothetical protein FEV51_08540 [Qipengyuania marisflavi]
MSQITKALIWATSILAVASAGRYGVMDADTAQTLTLTLPALAIASLAYGRKAGGRCPGLRA